MNLLLLSEVVLISLQVAIPYPFHFLRGLQLSAKSLKRIQRHVVVIGKFGWAVLPSELLSLDLTLILQDFHQIYCSIIKLPLRLGGAANQVVALLEQCLGRGWSRQHISLPPHTCEHPPH